MEKNTTLINPKGKLIKVADHMVSDMLKHGCTVKSPQRKDAPEELRRPIKLPEAKVITPEPAKEPLPEMQNSKQVDQSQIPHSSEEFEKPERKKPVRSKSTK